MAATFPQCAIVEAACCAEALAGTASIPLNWCCSTSGCPTVTGLQVLEELRRLQPDCPCVITTVFDDDEHVFQALRAGAAGYVLKDQSQHELGDLLEQMLDGRPPMSPGIARRMLHHFSVTPVSADVGTRGPSVAPMQSQRTRSRAASRTCCASWPRD